MLLSDALIAGPGGPHPEAPGAQTRGFPAGPSAGRAKLQSLFAAQVSPLSSETPVKCSVAGTKDPGVSGSLIPCHC